MSETKSSTLLAWAAVITAIAALLTPVLSTYVSLQKPAPQPIEASATPKLEQATGPSAQMNPEQVKKQRTSGHSEEYIPDPSPSQISGDLIKSVATGQVVDRNGQGVAGAKVRCTDCLTPDQQVVTDEGGNFALPFQVERKHEIQQIHLSVSGRKDLYDVTLSDPKGQLLQLK